MINMTVCKYDQPNGRPDAGIQHCIAVTFPSGIHQNTGGIVSDKEAVGAAAPDLLYGFHDVTSLQ